jgi:ankyrin repeat protein
MQTELPMAEFEDGRTDLVGTLLEAGIPANFQNQHGVSLIQTCAYYGDLSAMRGLLARGASLQTLGPNLGLNAACFHGHWRLCLLLLEHGANVNDQSRPRRHRFTLLSAAPTAVSMTGLWKCFYPEAPILTFQPQLALRLEVS